MFCCMGWVSHARKKSYNRIALPRKHCAATRSNTHLSSSLFFVTRIEPPFLPRQNADGTPRLDTSKSTHRSALPKPSRHPHHPSLLIALEVVAATPVCACLSFPNIIDVLPPEPAPPRIESDPNRRTVLEGTPSGSSGDVALSIRPPSPTVSGIKGRPFLACCGGGWYSGVRSTRGLGRSLVRVLGCFCRFWVFARVEGWCCIR